MSSKFLDESFHVRSSKVQYTEEEIISSYSYTSTLVEGNNVIPVSKEFNFYTKREVSKTGIMLVGWGGNNGSTFTAGIIANKYNISWNDKDGTHYPNYFGSLTQSSTVRLGSDASGTHVYTPFKNILPMLDPNELVIGGWDISSRNLAGAMTRAKVLDYDLQSKLIPYLKDMIPLPSIYYEDFIAANQNDRADNLIQGTKSFQLQTIRENIRQFKSLNNLEKVVVLWTANTERFADIIVGINDTADNLLASIERGESEVSPSTMFAIAAILENCTFINGSPQNTFVPGVMELASNLKVSIAGDDFKSGQTKLKSCLVDLLVSAGIKPVSIASYNHLGNNDGKNLSAPEQFRSKEISKSGVVEDMVDSNRILYKEGEKPDHCVVIKYIPYVGDSKRALDEYTSEIFMGGKNTIVIHNTCEDSLLATPLIIDLVVLAELCDRIQVAGVSPTVFPAEKMHSVLSILAYLLKAPVVPPGAPVVNALGPQRQGLVNFLLACIGLPPEDFMLLEHKLPSEMKRLKNESNGYPTSDELNNHLTKTMPTTTTTTSVKNIQTKHKTDMNGNGNGHHINKKPRQEI